MASWSERPGRQAGSPVFPAQCFKDLAFLFVPSLPHPVADVSDISRFLGVFHKPHVGVIQAAQQLLSGEQAPLRQKLLADLLHTVSGNIEAETRAEDPPWFEGASGSGAVGLGVGVPSGLDLPEQKWVCLGSHSEGLPDRGLA